MAQLWAVGRIGAVRDPRVRPVEALRKRLSLLETDRPEVSAAPRQQAAQPADAPKPAGPAADPEKVATLVAMGFDAAAASRNGPE